MTRSRIFINYLCKRAYFVLRHDPKRKIYIGSIISLCAVRAVVYLLTQVTTQVYGFVFPSKEILGLYPIGVFNSSSWSSTRRRRRTQVVSVIEYVET